MTNRSRKWEYLIFSLLIAAMLIFAFGGCDGGYTPGGCGGIYPTPTPTPDPTPGPTPNPNEPAEFEAKANGAGSGSSTSSAHFRVYTTANRANQVLEHLEAAYEYFITDGGFRSTGLSRYDTQNKGPYYKTDVVFMSSATAGGYMHENSGSAWLEINSMYINDPRVVVHEYGHAINLHQIKWVEQKNTGAWWETFANWVADTYLTSSYFAGGQGYTLIDFDNALDILIGNSYYTIVHKQNYYQAWPFFTYLTNNPDNYPGLGKMTLVKMNSQYNDGSNETPLHALERLSSVSVQTILGRYWARMAYMDIGHPMAQQVYFGRRSRLNFANLDSYGSQTYRVKSARKPMYGGANIIPLKVSGSNVGVAVTNLGNGLSGSNFTATLAIRSSSGSVRYVDLPKGSGQATVGSGEEASLVVVNTPDSLIKYNAFNSTANSSECVGLNYQVQITGAAPAN